MAYRTIIADTNPNSYAADEKIAAGTITPGMLIELTSSGTVQAHSTEGGRAERAFAVENDLLGKVVGTNYSATERVQIAHVLPGRLVNALIQLGEAGSIGDELVSGGDGTLINASSLSSTGLNKQVIAILQETVTTLAANTLKTVRMV
jgi:hypothetical protein